MEYRIGSASRPRVSVDTPDWVRDAAFYQIFPDRFAASDRVRKPGSVEPWDTPPTTHGFKGGDLLGIVERLDYLEDLGVNAIYMTPIFQSASNHRYHTYDYFKVDPLLGGDAALRELLDRAHERDIRVVLDGVFNHTGRGFWPFHHILEAGAASPYRDWFHLDPDVLAGHRLLTPYPPLDAPTGFSLGYKAWWGLPALPKINTDHPDAREYLMSVAEHWLRFGIDGWRLDVPTEIDDPSFWAEFRRRCRAIRPDAYLVGEIWEVAPDWVGDDGFDALMDYPLGEAILGFVGGPSLDMGVVHAHHEYRRHLRPLDGPAFATRLEELLGVYDPDVVAVQLNLIGSHDAPRALAVLGGDLAALRMATLLQCTLARRPVHLLRRRDRPDGRQRSGQSGLVPVGHGSLGCRAPSLCPVAASAALVRAGLAARVDDRPRRRRRGVRLRATAGRGAPRRRRQRGGGRGRARSVARRRGPGTARAGRPRRRGARWRPGGR